MLTLTNRIDMRPGAVPLVIHLGQYDSDFSLVFELYSSAGNFTVESGTTAMIRGTKTDGNAYDADATIDVSAKTVTVAGSEQMTAAKGRNVYELVLTKSGKVLSTANFILDVERAAMDADTIASESVLKELNAIIAGAETATQAAADAASAADRAEDAADSVSSASAQIATNTADIADLKEDLSESVSDLKSALRLNVGRAEIDNSIYNLSAKGIDKDTGEVKDASWTYASGYIPVYKGDVITYNDLKGLSTQNVALIAFYDENYTFIDAPVVGNNSLVSGRIIVQTSGYIRSCTTHDGNYQISITSFETIDSESYTDAKIAEVNETIQPLFESTKKLVIITANDKYKANSVLGSNVVGQEIVFVSNSYRLIARAKVDNTVKAIRIVYANVDNNTQCCVVTDENNVVLKIVEGSYTNLSRVRIDLTDIDGAVYVYWPYLNNSRFNTYAMYERDDYVIYSGDKVGYSSHDGTIFYDPIDGGNAYKVDLSPSSGTSGRFVFDIPLQGFTAGVWVKMPNYDEVKNTESINFVWFNGSVGNLQQVTKANYLQLGEWVFIKSAFGDNFNSLLTSFEIRATFKSGYSGSVTILVSDHVVSNHMVKPIHIINNDSFWGASERCGYYDYLIDNKIPFTVTGVFNSNDPVSSEYRQTLYEAYKNGLLDVGIYTNEQPTDYPISTQATSFLAVQNSMEHLIETKIADGYDPVSVGAGQHFIPPAIKRSIAVSGFNAIRAGFTESNNVIADSFYADVIYYSGNCNNAVSAGGTSFGFAHGVSTNPSGEYMPSIYAEWSVVKSNLDNLIALRDAGEIVIMNMKQYSEYRRRLGYPNAL